MVVGYIDYQDGIKKPVTYETTEEDAIKQLKKSTKIFEKTLWIDREYPNSYRWTYINYRIYNKNANAKTKKWAKEKMDLKC